MTKLFQQLQQKVYKNKETGEVTDEEVELTKDEGNRPETNLEGLSSLPPVYGEGKFITAGKCFTIIRWFSFCCFNGSKVKQEKRNLRTTWIL